MVPDERIRRPGLPYTPAGAAIPVTTLRARGRLDTYRGA
jgi:hypothetical protein